MSIRTDLTYEAALALPPPREIWLNGSKVVVYTGVDVIQKSRTTSPYDFRQRYTADELSAIIALAYSGDALIRAHLLKLQTTDNVDLDNTDVQAGTQYLVDKGILTAQRRTEILS